MLKLTFSGFADEISNDLHEQIKTLKELGISYMELRSIDKINVSLFTLEQAKEYKKILDENGIKVSSIGSPIGKVKMTDDFEEHFELFKHVVDLAKLFETKYIRIFSFYMEEENDYSKYESDVISRLSRMIEYAKSQNIILLHENEKGIYGDIDQRCEFLFKNLFCDNFKCTFDPANFVQTGCNTLEAFERLKGYIEYMHVKDARASDNLVVPSGKGDGNVKAIYEKLSEMNYIGFASMEPHLKKFAGLEALENGDNKSVADNEEFDRPTAFALAYNSLRSLIANLL